LSGEALEARRTFHPKVYVCRSENRVEAIVGSANFTRGGLRTNVETAVFLSGPAQEPVLQDLTSVFERQWESPLSRTVTPELREAYRALQTARGRAYHEALLQRGVRREEARLRNAVADLLVPPRSLAQATGRTWLLITNEENYRLCVEDSTWGNPKRSQIEGMRPGDRILFYIKRPHMVIGAAGLVSSEVYEDRRPLWKDREYPFRLRLLILLEPKVQVPIKPLVAHLPGFGNTPNWRQKLQRSQLELSPADAAFLWDTIRAASTPVRLLDSTLFTAADSPTVEGDEPE
jgi:hypothetical protein